MLVVAGFSIFPLLQNLMYLYQSIRLNEKNLTGFELLCAELLFKRHNIPTKVHAGELKILSMGDIL